MVVSESPNEMVSREEHPENAKYPTDFTEDPILTSESDVHPTNMHVGMFDTGSGIVTDLREEQPQKTSSPYMTSEAGSCSVRSEEHSLKA